MRFGYGYKTGDNETRFGEIRAASRDDAFRLLKARGIRPFKVELAPGLVNQFLGRHLRKAIFAVALVVALAAVGWAFSVQLAQRPFSPSPEYAALVRDARRVAALCCATNCSQTRMVLRQLFAERFERLAEDPRERERAKLLYGELSLDIDVVEDRALMRPVAP